MKGLPDIRDNMEEAEIWEYNEMEVVDADPVIPVGTKIKIKEYAGFLENADAIYKAIEALEIGHTPIEICDQYSEMELACVKCFALTEVDAAGINICELESEYIEGGNIFLPYALLEYTEIETETPDMEIRKKDITYEYQFTDLEIAEKNQELNALLTEMFAAEARKKDITSSLGAKIKGLLEDIKLLHEGIESGLETKMATCKETKDYELGTVIYTDDEGDIILERKMTDEENQISIEDVDYP